jgi:uncharacterized protein YkwD
MYNNGSMFDVSTLLAPLSFTYWGFNLIDLIILVVILFYSYEGYSLGFVIASLDLVSFLASFIIALKFYPFFAQLLSNSFLIPIGFANAISFFLIAFLIEIFLLLLFRRILMRLPSVPQAFSLATLWHKFDHWLGIIPGIVSAFIILAFLLSVIVSLPSSPFVKQFVTGSRIGEQLVTNTSFFEKKLNDIFGGAFTETLTFLTVKPQSNELVTLHFTTRDGVVDSDAEQEMFHLVTTERIKAGLPPLFWDESLADVARAHSQDMLIRGYFSHYTPEGLSPFDRMGKAGIAYQYAGENLALAPITTLAMQGLMNSPGHRANILNPSFTKVGIGVIDGGIYGKMYSQEFTD